MTRPVERIDPATLRKWIQDGRELAILDAREEGEFGASHLFWAVPCPLSRAELRVPVLLPRIATRIVCVDDGRGLAERLAEYLASQGATDLHILEGGAPAWEAAGFVLFSGVNVPSKAFGEWVEHHYGTESVDAPELKAWIDSGRDMVVLDSRPLDEFRRMSIPTGINVPGGELAYRIADLVPDPATLIVVNCAGRTRSIMGAESLRRAGVPNPVVALRNGTMGWELAGMTCERGQTRSYAPGTPASAALALRRADGFARETGVRFGAPEAAPGRTTYYLDVRSPEEYAAGHLPGFRHAPGGQLIQATDQWVAVRHARIVLSDLGDGARARMSAAWLRLMGGWEVHVLEGRPEGALGTSMAPAIPTQPSVSVAELAATPNAVVIDLARSVEYRAGHIPGALWGVRHRMAGPPPTPLLVVTAPDAALAHLAAAELGARVLQGGTAAWAAAGHPLTADRRIPADADCIDFYLRPYDRNSGIEDAMRAYLSWEIDLVHEVARDGDAHFGRL